MNLYFLVVVSTNSLGQTLTQLQLLEPNTPKKLSNHKENETEERYIKFKYNSHSEILTCFLEEESAKLIERFVANLVGMNQLSFLPWTN